uniref:USP domain-containing protein n=1 Tax=Echinococcus granulosus TaxID=6210 RepID=A0A068WV32_ECHGR|nr:hypothetical protein EgrG_002028700 [Echinococcus granulosus]
MMARSELEYQGQVLEEPANGDTSAAIAITTTTTVGEQHFDQFHTQLLSSVYRIPFFASNAPTVVNCFLSPSPAPSSFPTGSLPVEKSRRLHTKKGSSKERAAYRFSMETLLSDEFCRAERLTGIHCPQCRMAMVNDPSPLVSSRSSVCCLAKNLSCCVDDYATSFTAGGMMYKYTESTTTADLDHWPYLSSRSLLYIQRSVFGHHGNTLNAGHYVTYRH